MYWLIRLSGFVLVFVTLIPLIPSGKWYVRWWDFPRLQLVFLLLIPLIAAIWTAAQTGFRWELACWILLVVTAMCWQGSHILPFSPVWKTEVADGDGDESTIQVMVSNLDYENDNYQAVLGELSNEFPDILLLVELDEQWREELFSLREKYEYHHEEVRGEGLGIAIWSKIRITHATVKHLISVRRASVWTQLEMASGEIINFVGVHPTPPGLLDSTGDTRRDSRVRDAELILVAKEIAARADEEWIVAGDFNDVAWSHTTRLFKRTSGLLDPRIGRTFMGTYMAQMPPCRCPIDHVFLSRGFKIKRLARKRITGSDHFAVLASIVMTHPTAGTQPNLEGDDRPDAEAIVAEGKADAEERDLNGDQ